MNRKLKKTLVMSLTLLLLMSSIPSFAASARFSDVPTSHWGYSYIEDMAKLGYLSGHPDGSFEPSGNLTFMQSMSALSRFANLTSKEEENAEEEYASLLRELGVSVDWEREALERSLYKGIITEEQLKRIDEGNMMRRPIQRQLISVFLANAMGLEERVKKTGIVALPFVDSIGIDSDKGKHIYVLVDVGVLSRDGKGGGKFEPKATLTRAEMATLLSKGHDYVKDNPVTEETESLKATIKKITNNAGMKVIVIENRFGEEEGYINGRDTTITIDGKESTISSLSEGQDVELEFKKNTFDLVSVKATSVEDDAVGIIKYIDSSNLELTLEYKDTDKKITTKDYDVDSKAIIYLDGKLAKLKDLEKESLVELKVKNSTIYEIEATSKLKKVEGIITKISPLKDSKDRYLVITIEDKDKKSHEFYTDSMTRIYRKRETANEKDLKLKDFAYIEGLYDLKEEVYLANEVDADVNIVKIKGQVTQVTYSSSKNILITIKYKDKDKDSKREEEKEETFELTRDAFIYEDEKIVPSLPTNPPYYAELVLEGDEIVKIYIDSIRSEFGIIGTIREIDHNRGIIYLEDYTNDGSVNYDDEIAIYFNKNVEVRDNKYKEMDYRKLARHDRISVFATKEGVNFVANTIQVR